jgi:CubicO group peptidase (beta-lactamase class C family)
LSAARLERIDELLGRHVAAGDLSGAVTLVARDGKIAHLAAHGVKNLETGEPMRDDTIFRIASMTKPVVATAVMLLVEEGKLRLGDPVSRFIPAFADVQVAVAAQSQPQAAQAQAPAAARASGPRRTAPAAAIARGGGAGAARNRDAAPAPASPAAPEAQTLEAERPQRALTIVDLLTHTSGVMSGQAGNAGGMALFESRMELGLAWSEGLASVPLDFQPGTRWAYSGLGGFDVLARVVEIVSGQRFERFVAERIFGPLGAEDIFFWEGEEKRRRVAGNYVRGQDGRLAPRPDPDMLSSATYSSGSGGLMSSAESYARFAMMLAGRGEWNGVRILSPRSVELIASPFVADTLPGRPAGEGFGLGVRVVTDPLARRTLLSNGSFGWSGAYGTHFWVDPEKNLVAILMIHTQAPNLQSDFETAVMQAVVD